MISESDFNVSMPDIPDFEPFRHERSDATAHSTVCSCNGSDQGYLDLALLFVEQTRLCRLLDGNDSFPRNSPYTWQGLDWAIGGLSNANWPFRRLKHRLSEWYSALPLRARYRPIIQDDLGRKGNVAVAVNRSFLHLAFSMAMLDAYQSRLGLSSEQDIGTSYETEACEVLMNDAAGRISHIMGNIEANGLELCLHPGAMQFAISASEVHLERLNKLDIVAQAKHNQCARVIELMQEAYFVPSQPRHFRPSPLSPSASHWSQVEEGHSEKTGRLPETIPEPISWEFDISQWTTSQAASTCNMADVEGLSPRRRITERWMAGPLDAFHNFENLM
jgi:hypothetical protein